MSDAPPTARRRLARLALPLALIVMATGATPAVAQRVPRWTFVVVGAAAAVLVLAAVARALRRVRRTQGQPRAVAALVPSAIALVVFVMLPAVHVARALIPPRDGTPRIHTGFGDWLGSEGYPLFRRHRGIDVAGRPGDDVLAAADGRVTVARDNRDLCGLIVVIDHDPGELRTVYCHFAEIGVGVGERVRRGQRIGAVGTSGQRALPGFEHVHLELQRGRDPNALENPLPRIVGCFDPAVTYPAGVLALTYPVRCRARATPPARS